MQSIAQYQYPIIVWRGEERFLWNPIHRKALKNRPEERVRLRIIEYLMNAGWSKHRITTEEAIPHYTQVGLRTDIICYNQTFDPKILIECKAESIAITGRTAAQIARYNQQVEAPYVLMSNGLQDFWYQVSLNDRRVTQLQHIPDILPAPSKPNNPEFDYWKQRGFAGSKAKPPLRRWLERALDIFDTARKTEFTKYLTFKRSPSDLDLNHYYVIIANNDYKTAVSFIDTRFGGSRIVGIINREGENIGVIEINLDLVFEEEHPNTSIYSVKGIQNMDIRKESDIPFPEFDRNFISNLPVSLLNLWKSVSD